MQMQHERVFVHGKYKVLRATAQIQLSHAIHLDALGCTESLLSCLTLFYGVGAEEAVVRTLIFQFFSNRLCCA